MRVRVSLRALWALYDMRQLLNFRKNRIYCWQIWSHKVLRYLAFVFLIGLYFANWMVWGDGAFYKAFFVLQNAMYAGALTSILFSLFNVNLHYLYFPKYFLLLNCASACALVKFLLGQKQVVWTPRKG